MTHVVVVGGGITGAAAAVGVHTASPGATVTVIEAAPVTGGKLALAEIGGAVVDVGAEALLNLRPEAVALAQASGLGEDVVYPDSTAANLWNRGVLHPMPRTLMGVPGDLRALTGVLSAKGLARAAMESHMAPPVLAEGDDISVGTLVEDRFGKEVVDRLVEPLLGGVYAGHARQLSLRAAVPQLAHAVDGSATLSDLASRALSRPASSTPMFAGIRGGVGRLPEAALKASGAEVRLNTSVNSLERTQTGWRVGLADEVIDCDAVVLATPARASAGLLAGISSRAAHELDRIEYASMAVLSFAFAERDLPRLEGSGFLTPPVDGRHVKAATFSANKWGWVADLGDALGVRHLRASIGRMGEDSVLERTDEELAALALGDLADAVGISVRPVAWHVQRWDKGLPQYVVGHLDRVASIRRAVADLPGLAVCGAAYDGVGIAACVASGQTAADKVLTDLARRD